MEILMLMHFGGIAALLATLGWLAFRIGASVTRNEIVASRFPRPNFR